MEQIIIALIFALFITNGIWFLYYKQSIQKQIDVLKQYNKSLQYHKEYLIESERKAKEFTISLNETVKLVTKNIELQRK